MMNVQGIGCQPIRHAYLNKSFGNQLAVQDDPFIDELNNEKKNFEQIRENSGSKVLSTVGTLGAATAAAALQFFTFKAIAPRAYKVLAGFATKVYNWKPVKASFESIGRGFRFVGRKASEFYTAINPETKIGKLKAFIDTKVVPFVTRKFAVLREFAQKHNLNKDLAKKSLLNTGAVCVSIPAAITTANLSENGGAEND